MALTKVKLQQFTAFHDLTVEFSPGINAFIGANGTGKTHLLKVCYAACDVSKTGDDLLSTLMRTFLPSGHHSFRLVKQGLESGAEAAIEVYSGERVWSKSSIMKGFSYLLIHGLRQTPGQARQLRAPTSQPKICWPTRRAFCPYMRLGRSTLRKCIGTFLLRAYLPALREPIDGTHEKMLKSLENVIGGKVTVKGEEFFLSNEQGDLEFTLLAEGWRKLGLLWLLIRNGTLRDGSVLFWDEPEANLNPKMFRVVIEALLELQRAGVQVFFATHDYVILKELDLQMTEEDAVAFHALYRDEDGEIACRSTGQYLDIHPNAIDERSMTFTTVRSSGAWAD